jgi:Ion channel
MAFSFGPAWRSFVTSTRSVYSTHGWIAGTLWLSFALPATPLTLMFQRADRSRQLIDLGHFLCLSTTVCVLAFLPATSPLYWLWPILRISNTLFIFMRALGGGFRARDVLRSVVITFIHYVEIILLFALVFLHIQARFPGPHPFLLNGNPAILTKCQTIYYSFTTAATIGFGDITPNHHALEHVALTIYSLIWLKTFAVLFIVVVQLSHIMNSENDGSTHQVTDN